MSATTLYELTGELREVLAALDFATAADGSGEIPADLESRLDSIVCDFSAKVDGVLRARVNFIALAEGIEVEVKRLAELQNSYFKRAEWLKQYVFTAMLATGQQKLDTKLFKLWIAKNSRPAVKLADGAEAPAALRKVVTTLDSDAALAAWKEWRQIDAAAREREKQAEACEVTGERESHREAAAMLRAEAERLKLPECVRVVEGTHLRIK